jgi:hypothetical protein
MALVHALAKVSIELIAIYFHFFEIFIIQIGEMVFRRIYCYISSQIIFRMLKKANVFVDDFEALVREHRFRALLCGCEMLF